MESIGLILLLVVLLGIFLFLRSKAKVEETRPEPVRRPGAQPTQFHAVSIRHETNACMAAKELAGRRFLSGAAPQLPLPECDAAECSCRFRHHDDRRSSKDRRSPFSASGFSAASGTYEREQREGSDRRKSDDDDFFR
ncbi:MAG: hypothetical protein WBN09_09505 [Woeseiaceae bacterium]